MVREDVQVHQKLPRLDQVDALQLDLEDLVEEDL